MTEKKIINNESDVFSGSLEGEVFIEMCGKSNLKRVITTIPGKKLKLKYISNDSESVVDDIIYVSENSELIYEGIFISEKNKFVNKIKVIHKEPNGKSQINVRGISKKDAQILTSGEIQKGAENSKFSIKTLVFLFDKGKVKTIPQIKISEPKSKAYHSFKKVRLTPKQNFYLSSKGLSKEAIESFYKQAILGD